ncbi:hypothetical protein B0T10DRAFT_465256 [Thelonectria olida]|uniref:Uncharacterized protein n=1 Tax=Thelonectria olida TaxID=1576542 RepID=A0A9P8VW48_9HYPO|nr:hypothetical protein B0T10DRAFT_465256 [Thelonectria olida]
MRVTVRASIRNSLEKRYYYIGSYDDYYKIHTANCQLVHQRVADKYESNNTNSNDDNNSMSKVRESSFKPETELENAPTKRPKEPTSFTVPELRASACRLTALDQERIEELSVRARQFYEQQMRIRRERRIARLIYTGILLAMVGLIYWLGKWSLACL